MKTQFLWRITNTLALYGCFFSLGSIVAIPGPTLIYLACLVDATVETISYIYPTRSLGYLIGSAFGGVLFDCLARKDKLVIASSLLVAAIGTGVAPWVASLPSLCIVFSIGSVALGALDTGGNVFCLRLWGSKGGPYIQALHFSFGLGAFLAPLVAAPFLSSTRLECNLTSVNHQAPQLPLTTLGVEVPIQTKQVDKTDDFGSIILTTTDISRMYDSTYQLTPAEDDVSNTDFVHEYSKTVGTYSYSIESNNSLTSSPPMDTVTSLYDEVTHFNGSSIDGEFVEFSGSQVKYCYLILAIITALFGFFFCFLGFKSDTIDIRKTGEDNLHVQDNLDLSLTIPTLAFKIKMIACASILFFLYVGVEVAYGQFLSLYSVSAHDFTEKQGALLTSVFWGMFAVMRGLAIPLSRFITPCKLIVTSIIITCISSLALTINAMTIVNDASLWIFTGCFGIGTAAIFPTGILWLENYMPLTGRIASVFVVSASLGEMAIPASFGLLFEHTGPTALMFMVLGCSAGCALAFGMMYLLTIPRLKCITSPGNGSEKDSIGLSSEK